jgi:hypothetical protein
MPYEGFLDDIFRVMIIEKNASGDAIKILVVAPNESAECRRIALQPSLEQFTVGGVAHSTP